MWTCRHRTLVSLVLLSLTASFSQAVTLNSIRFGTHDQFDRIVCDLSAATTYDIKALPSGVLELYLHNADVSEKFFLPKLPANMKVLTVVEAFRESERDLVIEIRGKLPLEANDIVLQGQTWRLALDISGHDHETAPAQKSGTDREDEPRPYIPGDKPIDTRLADEEKSPDVPAISEAAEGKKQLAETKVHAQPEPHSVEKKVADKPEQKPKVHETASPPRRESDGEKWLARLQQPLLIQDPVDTLKALDVLASFYQEMGDSESAAQFEEHIAVKSNEVKSPPSHKFAQSEPSEPRMADWLLVVLAIVGGVAGGVLGTRIAQSGKNMKLSFRLPKMPKLKRRSEASEGAEPAAKELKRHGDELERAIAKEKRPAPKEVPAEVINEAESAFPADEPGAEVMMKESLMDRRVKRVLELSSQKRNIAEIAKELDMGQDEVKLILDLNS